jgi:cell division protein FtsI/penicillin-binding protein 2
LRDARGRQILADGLGPTASGAARAAVAGLDIVLTIDRAIQYQAEQVLVDTVAKFQAKGAVAVVMDPRTGAILAMAQAPTFDPNQAADASGQAAPSALRRKLRAITDVFEPGSTFKVFLMAAGIEAGVTRAD